jgi:alkylation response protein AidB-like acyl-CoA dehydrogenase
MAAMYFAVSPEQEMLRDATRSYLSAKVPLTKVRELMETNDGLDQGLWDEMADMGWQSLAIPEAYGGAGYTFLELGILIEEMGRALTPAPFFSSVVLGANAILHAGTEEQRTTHLPGIASGETRVAVAIVEPGRGWSVDDVALSAEEIGDGWVVSGKKSYVLDGHTADLIIVAGRDASGEVGLFLVDAAADGVSVERIETLDMTRKQASIEFSDAVALERLGSGSSREAIERLYDIAAVMLAFEQIGGAQRCMEMSVDYAKERVQFGRPIGSFQSIKHKCADMLVDVEAARSTAQYAGWALTAEDDDLGVAAALAKVRCSDAFFSVAADTIQVHGGIGFTWEHDAHLYFKRAKTDQLLFGSPAEWREKLADRLGL